MKKIKVLHIFASLNRGGAETMVVNYFEKIDKSKFEFFFISFRSPKKQHYEDLINNLGGKIYKIPKLSILNFRKIKNAFFSILSEIKPDLIHFHYITLGPLFVPICKKIGIRTITHAHNSKVKIDILLLLRLWIIRYMRYFTNFYLSCSSDSSKFFFGNEASKALFLYNSIDYNKFNFSTNIRIKIREKLNLKNDLLVGNVSRFYKQKNHKFIINVFKKIHNIYSNSKLLLIGEGPELNKIIKYVKKQNLSSNVIFLGSIPNVYEYLNAFDAFILPSKYEGLPLSIIESQVNGVPTFITSTITEELKISNNLYFIPLKNNPSDWANKIISVTNTSNRQLPLSNLSQTFSSELNIKKLEEIYITFMNS